jgi:hypothetical protein
MPIVTIQEPLADDSIVTPLKVDRSALPDAEEWDSTSFKRGQDVVGSWRGHSLVDHHGLGPDPAIKHQSIRTFAAAVRSVGPTNS